MKRRVFFSFHYGRDVGRIGQIRNSWLTKGESSKFLDAAEWESIKRNGDAAISNWINEQLNGTSVTVVLIGAKTADRRWVRYEIKKSIAKRNGLVGIYIHNVKDFKTRQTKDFKTRQTDDKGENPFEKHFGFKPVNHPVYPCCNDYDWVNNDGYNNIEDWIETAAQQAGR